MTEKNVCSRLNMQLACKVSDVAPDAGFQVHIDGRAPIAVFKVDGNFFAIDDTCSHGAASLCDGFIENGIVECPFHGATFDIRTGEALSMPATQPMKTYPIQIDGDAVYVRFED
ncbi:MAG: (2Fe-2S)-binding protein [Herminiimonas sp.]|nr:(2Fe-2S)-binding protein [Herminiimonas sp.]